jgi:predicted ATP-dependent serine protease
MVSGGKEHELVRSSELFVGRGRSLEMIKAAVDEALRGRGALVLVSGEARIGKTRLAEAAAAYAATRNVTVLWASCWKVGVPAVLAVDSGHPGLSGSPRTPSPR